MKKTRHIIFLLAIACCGAPARAELIENGNGLVTDTALNIVWTQNGNLFKTMAEASGDPSAFVANLISTVGGRVYDKPNIWDTPANSGYHLLSSSDFNTDTGAVTWYGAMAWVDYLNAIRYQGYADWRLPATLDTGAPGPQCANNFSDCGDYNVDAESSEMAHLYYVDLQNQSAYNADGSLKPGTCGVDWGMVNPGPFTNVQNNAYWSGTENVVNAAQPWFFATFFGSQGANHAKISPHFAWAVRSLEPSPIRTPAAAWLLGGWIAGVLALAARKDRSTP